MLFPVPRRAAPRFATELEQRLARDAASFSVPSPALRPRILRTLREARSAAEASGAPPAARWRSGLGVLAAAALVVLLLWDPTSLLGPGVPRNETAQLPATRAFVGRILGWTEAAPLVREVDRPLRSEMDGLLLDGGRVAEGFVTGLSESPLARLLTVRPR